MIIDQFYCAGCRETLHEPDDALALSPHERNPTLLVLLHPDERCARRLHLNNPGWCPARLDLSEPPTVGWCRRVGFEVTGWGDARGYARARYRGAGTDAA